MTGPHDIREIKQRLARRVDEVVRRFFPAAIRDGDNYWRMGSINGEAGQSLWIWRRGPKAGEWADGAAGTGGDILALVQSGLGGEFREALQWAADWTGAKALDNETPAQREARDKRWREEEERRARREAEELARKRLASKALFLSGVPIHRTGSEHYLLGRAIDLSILDREVNCLRHHDACPVQGGGRRPALLAAVVDGEGQLTVHRHFIHRLPSGEWVKASDKRVPEGARMDGKSAKQAYSSFGGGIIPAWRGAGGKSWRNKNCGEQVIAAEGLEDALSWAIARPDMRVCAAISLGNLGKIWLPESIKSVLWHRHRGDPPEAVALYQSQAEALRKRGIALADLWAPGDCKDVNEWLQAQEREEE